ncbi:uncharacterized protein KY384_006558 [Bacidia gigantensis]|uniref:uncharacterized protein n=1 Tax=Bacidia gigantensis TaxID=2732470 RepID=UPI001D0590A6|nr:uncharacterized protein KY384_006558 [Bacidia gigantensis]KAG8528869.1 hypothetical protein KY384_006558 [Bacidia gigantensis]
MTAIMILPWALLRLVSGMFESPKYPKSNQSEPTDLPVPYDSKRLAASSDFASLPAIAYAYDPLPAQRAQLPCPLLSFPDQAALADEHTSLNSIRLDPIAAGLQYRSSIDHVRASKHFTANFDETLNLIRMLAEDDSASDVEAQHGITLAKLAKKAIRPGLEHQMVLAAHYMFPGADEQRIAQIAALTIMYFVFDDKVEETPDRQLHIFRNDFIRRLQGRRDPDAKVSAFQNHVDSIVQGIEAEDAAGGDGGREMIDALRGAFKCVHPPEQGFRSVAEYLTFRRQNVGADFVVAAAKFAIKSSVDTTSPLYTHFITLISDHLGIVNDLYSYDKEARALAGGEISDIINLVDVIKNVTGLKGTPDAKSVAWSLQLQVEREIWEELEGFKGQDLGDEVWAFLDAVVTTATGNVMFCMTTSRYGGEAARI